MLFCSCTNSVWCVQNNREASAPDTCSVLTSGTYNKKVKPLVSVKGIAGRQSIPSGVLVVHCVSHHIYLHAIDNHIIRIPVHPKYGRVYFTVVPAALVNAFYIILAF